MRSRHICAAAVIAAGLVFTGTAAISQASPGHLKVLVDGNVLGDVDSNFVPTIQSEPGVASVTTFNSRTGTLTAAQLDKYDLVVDTGDNTYADATTWGDELANYLDAGGALIQFAYDNWKAREHLPRVAS